MKSPLSRGTRKLALGAAVAIQGFLVSCTHSIHQVQVSDFHPYSQMARGQLIRATGEQFVIMGFAKDSRYVDQAHGRLKQQCPDGYITGITSQLSTSHGFFSWTNKVLLQGRCINANTKS